MSIDVVADGLEVSVDLQIRITEYQQTDIMQVPGSYLVGGSLRCGKVAAAIQFDDEFGLCAIEVDDVIQDGLLSLPANMVGAKKIIPEFSLPWGGI
nr:hypothetical protein [Bifidobacterium margollesii]